MFISIISVLLVLGGLIFFHELGHFIAARAFGMGVSTFSLGFGPKLLKFVRGKTEYCLSAIPLGGYVSLVGQSEDEALPEGFDEQENFAARPPWQRLIVVAAGPLANLLLAWFICWGIAAWYGEAEISPNIGAIEANSPAAKAGILPGDVVLAINGTEVDNWLHISQLISASKGTSLSLDLARQGRSLSLTLTPTVATRKNLFGEEEQFFRIGIRSSGEYSFKQLGLGEAAASGMRRSLEMLALTWQGMVKLAQRIVPLEQVGGPILIAQMVGKQAQEGASGLLVLTALISINLAVLNLLPIPVLDGGHILFYSLETIMRRPLHRRIRLVATQIGFAFLVCLMVLATFNDIWRIIQSD